MKTQYIPFKKTILLLTFSILLTGCEEMNSKMENQLDNINARAVQLDSVVNDGLNKVEKIDSTITSKTRQIKDLDSLVQKTGTRIDSLMNRSISN